MRRRNSWSNLRGAKRPSRDRDQERSRSSLNALLTSTSRSPSYHSHSRSQAMALPTSQNPYHLGLDIESHTHRDGTGGPTPMLSVENWLNTPMHSLSPQRSDAFSEAVAEVTRLQLQGAGSSRLPTSTTRFLSYWDGHIDTSFMGSSYGLPIVPAEDATTFARWYRHCLP